MSWKPWIGVDLDGTLAKHYWPDDGPYHPLRIGDPIHRMVERVKLWIAEDKEVRIFTARVAPLGSSPGFNDEQQLPLIHATIAMWTQQHIGVALAATCMKDYCMTELWDDRAYRVEHNTGLVDIRTHPDMPLNMHMWLPPGVDVETAIRLLKSEYRPVKQDKEPTTNADTTAPETCDAESPSVVTDSDGPIRTKRLSEYEAPKQPFRK